MPHRDDVEYLRRKARQFRELASEYSDPEPISANIWNVAEALESHAESYSRGTGNPKVRIVPGAEVTGVRPSAPIHRQSLLAD